MKFFHAYASARKKSNVVSRLRTDEGEFISNKDDMNGMVVYYFKKVFTEQQQSSLIENEGVDKVIIEEQNLGLTAEISFEEFTAAVKQMHHDKASGPDGLNSVFFPTVLVELRERCF